MSNLKSLEQQRAEALSRLPDAEVAKHNLFSNKQYPWHAWQINYNTSEPEIVTICSYGFADHAEALIPTVLCSADGSQYRCCIDMIHLTEQEAWQEIVKVLQKVMQLHHSTLMELAQQLANLQLQLDKALEAANK